LPVYKFKDAVTIVSNSKNLEKFNEIFSFVHGLDCIEITNEQNEVEGIYELKTKYETLKVQISNASNTQELDFISQKYSQIYQHSFIIIWEKNLDFILILGLTLSSVIVLGRT
jgi:hypothetical protein